MISITQKLLGLILRVEMWIAFLTLTAMTLALSVDVIGRELFKSGVFGSVKFAVYALIFCAMAGFGIATATGGHLRPKFLDKMLPPGLTGAATRAGNLASALILLALAWGGWQMVQFSIEIEDTDLTLGIPVWPIQLAVPLGFALSALRHLLYAVYPDEAPAEGALVE